MLTQEEGSAMLLLRRPAAAISVLILAAACAEAPTAPDQQIETPPPDLSVITPILLPPGADWGLYFVSFNQTRTLHASAIHYPDGSASGTGSFTVPGVSGLLQVTSVDPYGDCLPTGSPCGTVTNVPESGVARGMATLLTGRRVPFTLDLHSNFWPVVNTYDTARLTLCSSPTKCRAYSFYGELHHEPQ
jgi:hypothetical protein